MKTRAMRRTIGWVTAGLLAVGSAMLLGCAKDAARGGASTTGGTAPATESGAGSGAPESRAMSTPAPPEGGKRSSLIAEGEIAPEFQSTGHDGTAVTLSALRGKPVVLYFYPKDDTPG